MVKILHIDEDKDFHNYAKQQLINIDSETEIDLVKSVDAAWSAISETNYDCILSDYKAPGVNELELLQKLDQKGERIPFVILASACSDADAEHALAEGVDDFFSKNSDLALYIRLDQGIKRLIELRSIRLDQASRSWLPFGDKYYRTLTENLSDWIWEVDINGVYTFASPRVEDMLGYKPAEIIGKTPFDLMPPEEAERVAKIFKEIVREQTPIVNLENVNIHKDGSKVVLETSGVPVFDNKDNLVGYRGVDRDITERKKTELELRKLTSAVQQSPGMVVITDTDGIIEYVNQKFTQITGFLSEDAIGKNISFLKSGDEAEEEHKKLWETITSGGEWHGEFLNQKKNEEFYWESVSISALRDAEGKITNFIKVAEDITKQKKLMEKAKLDQEQLFQASKMAALGTLVSGVAHEINNPNQYVLGNLSILTDAWSDAVPILDHYFHLNGDFLMGGLKYSQMRKKFSQIISRASKGSERIKYIVKELRDFAIQKPATMTDKVVINEVAESSIALVSNLLKKATNNFDAKLIYGIPKFQGNFQRMEQVIINLLVNACQALPNKDCGIFLSTRFDKKSHEIVIKIQDEGEGIPEELVKHVTDPFFTTKRDSEGTGLGLSMSSTIISEHNGSMDISSKVGDGTTVTITIPVDKENFPGNSESQK